MPAERGMVPYNHPILQPNATFGDRFAHKTGLVSQSIADKIAGWAIKASEFTEGVERVIRPIGQSVQTIADIVSTVGAIGQIVAPNPVTATMAKASPAVRTANTAFDVAVEEVKADLGRRVMTVYAANGAVLKRDASAEEALRIIMQNPGAKARSEPQGQRAKRDNVPQGTRRRGRVFREVK